MGRKGLKRKSSVLVEKDEVVVSLGRRLGDGIRRVGNVLYQHSAIRFEECTDFRRQGVDGFVDD